MSILTQKLAAFWLRIARAMGAFLARGLAPSLNGFPLREKNPLP